MADAPFLPHAVITEGFDVLTGISPNQCATGWTCTNNSAPLGDSSWYRGLPITFPAQAGAPNTYIAANFKNTAGGGTIDNWLISPQVSFGTGATLSFWSRTSTELDFPDRLEIRLSTAGAATTTGSFSVVLGTINPALAAGAGHCVTTASGTGGYPNVWCQYTLTATQGMPTTGSGRLAFRYFVTNAGPAGDNSDYIGIDTFSFDEGVTGTPPAITSPAPPAGTTGAPYSFTVTATGTGPITFSISGTLPAGLTLNPTTGVISGTPTAAGVFSFTITATGATAPPATQVTSITILAPAVAVNTMTALGLALLALVLGLLGFVALRRS